jgi:acyl-coenzyme A thioesterase PaaI-like protein
LTSDVIATDRTGAAKTASPAAPGRVDRRFAFEPHNCFACGSLNTTGIQLDLHVDGERCWTTIALPRRFQGWDGIAHGGIICSILDEVMAWSLVDHDNWGLTARLSVDFKRPVPLETPIRAEGWITRTRRRLISTAGRIVDPATDALLATAEATYVAAPEDRKRELKERYGFRLIDAAPAASATLQEPNR